MSLLSEERVRGISVHPLASARMRRALYLGDPFVTDGLVPTARAKGWSVIPVADIDEARALVARHEFHVGLVSSTFFADRVLAVMGEAQFLLLYFTAVVVAFMPTTLRFLKSHKYSSLGASGAVAAVMFSGILMFPLQELYLFFLPIKVPGYIFAVAYLAYSAWHSYSQSDNINHDAHFYGAAYGLIVTYLLEPRLASRGIDTMVKTLSG